jgi:hypothetical protein
MPPVAAAILPHPPLLVHELAGGAAGELDPLRAACRAALSAVLAAADLVILVGDGPVWGVPEPAATGSFRPYGADVEVALPAPAADLDLSGLPEPVRLTSLPLSLAVAAALLAGRDPAAEGRGAVETLEGTPPAEDLERDRAGGGQGGGPGGQVGDLGRAPARLFAATVPATLGPGAAASIGRTLAATGDRAAGAERGGGRVGLVAMGDLSACRSERAPGAFRPEAAGFDASVGEAFRSGQPARLLDLEPGQAAELLAAGRVPLQVLAGALDGAPALHGQVLYEDAPYGVGYLVALLTVP